MFPLWSVGWLSFRENKLVRVVSTRMFIKLTAEKCLLYDWLR